MNPEIQSPDVIAERLVPLTNITQMTNPRQKYDRDQLKELADSIERHGQLQPVIVRTGSTDGCFDLIAGSRRLRAFQLLAEKFPGDSRWSQIRVSVQDQHTGSRLKAVQAIENIKRADLTALELADAVLGLRDDGLSSEAIAEELGYSKRHVERLAALGAGPDWLRAMADAVEVTEPILDEEGNRVLDEAGKPRMRTRRLPGFGLNDVAELLSFFRTLDAWDRKQQDTNTAHRPKAELETQRIAKKAAVSGLSGDKLKSAIKARLAELTGAVAPRQENEKSTPTKKPYEVTEKRVLIDVEALKAPLTLDDLAQIKPALTQALQRLGFTTIKLA